MVCVGHVKTIAVAKLKYFWGHNGPGGKAEMHWQCDELSIKTRSSMLTNSFPNLAMMAKILHSAYGDPLLSPYLSLL